MSAGHFDGTTACAVTIVGKQVICCNAGDSRAIIVKRDGTAVALSQDHKPDRHDETKRISDLGGRVIHWGRWRIEGVLAVSRSIGDSKLKPFVTAEPETVVHEIGELAKTCNVTVWSKRLFNLIIYLASQTATTCFWW